MFGIPGKQAVSITDKAATQIAKLMAKDGSEGLRIGVKKGGCAGMEYTMEYVNEINPLDETIETLGARVMIAPMAQIALSAQNKWPYLTPISPSHLTAFQTSAQSHIAKCSAVSASISTAPFSVSSAATARST